MLTDRDMAAIERTVCDVLYANYRYNRDRTPSILPEQWKRIYGEDVGLMELRYQHEREDAIPGTLASLDAHLARIETLLKKYQHDRTR